MSLSSYSLQLVCFEQQKNAENYILGLFYSSIFIVFALHVLYFDKCPSKT